MQRVMPAPDSIVALQPEPNDGYRPRPMPEAKVLYRSVSLPELADIWHEGAVLGGGSLFNPFEWRPYVFFADTIDDRLLGQGEGIDRQAIFALRSHAVATEALRIDARIEKLADQILSEMDRDRIRYPVTWTTEFRLGWERRRFRSAAFRHRPEHHRKYAELFRRLSRFVRDREDADAAYGDRYRRLCSEVEQRLDSLPYSSAVLVTHPVGGGLVYSSEFGASGHGGKEYALGPGQAKVADIAKIILVKAGQMLRTVDVSAMPSIVRGLPRSWPSD